MAASERDSSGAHRDDVSLARRVPPTLVFKWAVAATTGALAVLAVAYGISRVSGILILVLIGLFVAVSLNPAVQWLVGHGMRRAWAVCVVVLALVGLFAVFLWSIVPPVVEQSSNLVGNLPSYIRSLSDESRAVREVTDRYHLTERLTSALGEIPGRLAGGVVGVLQRFFGTLAAAVTVLVLSIYFMVDMPRLERGLVRLFPPKRRAEVAEVVDIVVGKVGGYMIGNLAISLVAGVAAYICLRVVAVPYALPLAIAVAITDLIPMIGATLGAVIVTLTSVLTVGVWPRSIIVLLFFIGYQQFENYIISPRVMRNAVDLSPVSVLVVALIGGTLLGLLGALMAIPIAAAAKVVMSSRLHPDDETPPPSTG
jgi:predicted PurR-regulated permease PerM